MLSFSCASTVEKQEVPAAVPEKGPLEPVERAKALKSPGVRLPIGARPLEYQLELSIVPGEDRFSGTVSATVEVDRPLDELWVNATDLTLDSVNVRPLQGSALAFSKVKPVVVDDHFAALVPQCAQACSIPVGRHRVEMAFSGVLSRKDSDGLFQLNENGAWYAYTSFEPIDARRAFPHFDEPQFKVPWEVSLVVKSDHSALSNMPQVAEEPLPNGRKRVRFSKSPPMPSYLVAVAVGSFEFVDAGKHGQKQTPVRIVVPKGKAREAAYAAQTSGPILEQLETYFGSPYPYDKLDQIALPVATGAMENPGLVTYGHQIILSKPELDTPSRQRGFAGTCTHELAHQWFGDLVTMAYWDDLWLNEAFATWMTPRLLEGWQPTWAMDVAQVNRRHFALGNDSLTNARQIRQPITSNDDIANAFDGITYGKGASVIGMFEASVGRETFQKGVRAYLEKHAWKNATADDFLSAISAAAGRDVGSAFKTFLDQPGAPVVTFALSCAKGQTPTLALQQRRALPVGSTGDPNKRWTLPICVRWSENGKEGRACTTLTDEKGMLELAGAKSCPQWVLPNDQYHGYYRANLTGGMSLVDVYKRAGQKLAVLERVGLLGDVSALVRSGDIDLSESLKLAELVAPESDRHLLGYALSLASTPGGDMLPEPLRQKHEAFVRRLFGKKLEQLGFVPKPREDEETRLLRPSLISTLGLVGKDPRVLSTARSLAEKWLNSRNAVHPDVVEVVLGLAGKNSDAAFQQKLLAAAKAEADRSDRGRIIGALSDVSDRTLVSSQLPLVLTDTFDIREAMRLVWGASSDFRTRDLALDFVHQNWEAIISKLPKDGGAGLVWLASGVCSEAERNAERVFFDGRSTKYLGGVRNFAIAMEGIDLCVAFRSRQRSSAVAFFEGRR
jgi:alanyl aminopeptidase